MKNGVSIGLTERPTYVEPLDNGSYGLCDESKARGIAYEGAVYSLEDRATLEGAETVSLIPADAGAIVGRQIEALRAAAEELTSTQLALCDVYELLTGGEDNG